MTYHLALPSTNQTAGTGSDGIHDDPRQTNTRLSGRKWFALALLASTLIACGGSEGGSGSDSGAADDSSGGDTTGVSDDGTDDGTDDGSGDGSGDDSGDSSGDSSGDGSGDGSGDSSDDSSGDGSGDDSGTDADTSPVTFTFSPEDQESNVATGRAILVEPDTSLDPSTLTADSVYIDGPNGTVDASIDYENDRITLTPSSSLAPSTDFMVRVTTEVMTADGSALSEPAYSGFRTMSLNAQPPALEQWESNMISYGHQWGSEFTDGSNDYITLLNYFYYDAERIYYQIADYTGEAEPWNTYAHAARSTYAKYLTDNDFRTSGYWRFPHGLFMDWERTNSSQARSYLIQLRDNAAFSDPDTNSWADGWFAQRYSREVAYALQNHMLAERAGEARMTERVNLYVDMALRHIESWTTGNWVTTNPDWQFVQAFMAGLTASALIDYHERSVELGSPDNRIPGALESLADWLWMNMWNHDVDGTGHGAFAHVTPRIEGVGSESPAPDLSLLIAPLYGWLYRETGASRHLERGDAVFEGGVELAHLNGSKRFNQSYRASFDYVEWRAAGHEKFGN